MEDFITPPLLELRWRERRADDPIPIERHPRAARRP